jgi:hypothetical protein
MGRQGLLRVKDAFALQRMINETEQVYEPLLAA